MPRAGDPRLIGGALPITHDPTKRLDVRPPKLDHLVKPASQAAADKNATGMLWTLSLDRIFHFTDWAELFSGKEDGDPTDLGTRWLEQKYKSQAAINNIVNKWFGWIADIDWDPEDSERALADQASTVAALSAAVAELQNDRNNAAANGKSAFVDFSIFPPATTLGADFAQQYSLAGDGEFGINNGAEWLVGAHTAERACKFLYLPTKTTTSYQRIGFASGSVPQPGFGSTPARNEIHGRVNDDHDTYIFWSMEASKAQLGFVVGDFPTVWKTTAAGKFSYKSNAIYWLECGTIGGLRIFRLLEGDKPVLTHVEVGTASQEGPAYTGAGGLVYAYANGFATNRPGRIAAFGFSDNQPAAVRGSTAHMYRSTGTFNVTAGTHPMPAGWCDVLGEVSNDIEADLPTSTYTVSVAGEYLAEAHVDIGSDLPSQLQLRAFRNGDPDRKMGPPILRGIATGGGTILPDGGGGSVSLQLDEGDVIELGYDATTDTLGGCIAGESAGFGTFFTLSLMSRSLL